MKKSHEIWSLSNASTTKLTLKTPHDAPRTQHEAHDFYGYLNLEVDASEAQVWMVLERIAKSVQQRKIVVIFI